MRISEIIPENYVGQTSPLSGNSVPKKKRAAQKKVEELVSEGPIWDKTKHALAGAAIAGAALTSPAQAQEINTAFTASAGSAEYSRMETLANKYYLEMLEKAKASGEIITGNTVRRMRQDAQYRAVRELST